MTFVRKYLSELSLGEQTVFKNLTMFGLEGLSDGNLDYLTLADAMKLEVARVSEISDGGSVPELLYELRSPPGPTPPPLSPTPPTWPG